MRSIRRAVVCAALGLIWGGVAWGQDKAAERRENPFGMHGPTYSHWLHAQRPNLWLEGEAHLRVMTEAGVGWARQDFWWSLAEPEQGKFVWDDFDKAVAAYETAGIKLLGILCYSSAWSGGVSPDSDAERARFATYVQNMVGRYKGRVAAWEVWNEPNIQPFWSPRPDPELYAKLLVAAYRAAKQADPQCVIVGGVFAGPDHKFLEGMYAAGVAGHFDVLSYHNYGQQLDVTGEWVEVERLRGVLRANGEENKPIWHTETGFFTGPVGLSEPEQASRIVRYSVGLLALGIERMFQLTLSDWTDDPKHADLSVYRGLTHADFLVKPSYAAYRTMCQRLANKKFAGALRPAPGVSGYLFDGAGESVLVMWRDGAAAPGPMPLNLGTPVVLVQQLDGNWQVHRSEKGIYALSVGQDPLYVLNPGAAITNQRYVRWANPVLTRIPREAQAVVEAEVVNPFDAPLELSLRPRGPAGVRFASEVIPPGQTRKVQIKVDAAQWAVGRSECFWSLSRGQEPVPAAQGWRTIEVESPVALSFEPVGKLVEAAPVLGARIEYRGTQPAEGLLRLNVNGKASGEPLKCSLQPAATQRVVLPFDLAALTASRPAGLELALETLGLKLTTAAQRVLLPCPPLPGDVQIDGDLVEWRERTPQIAQDMLHWEYVNASATPDPRDQNVRGWVGWDQRGLWLALEVQDDLLALPESRAVWNWDSLQVGLDPAGDAQPEQGYDDDDLEIELGAGRGGPPWCYLGYCPPGWPEEQLSAKLQGAVRVDTDAKVISYELLVPAELLVSATKLEADAVLGFSIMVNDNDQDGRAGWQELTPGIGMGKAPGKFAWLWLRGADQ